MRLRRVQVENLRAFQAAEMQLPPDGLVLVAGANNSGKTALLSAFDIIAGDQGDITSLRHAGSEEPARLRATFDLDGPERAAILENASGGWALMNAGVLSSLQFAYEQWPGHGLMMREVLGYWPGLGLQPVARMEPDATRDDNFSCEVIGAFPQQDNGRRAQPGEVQDVQGQSQRLLVSWATTSRGDYGLDTFLSGQPVLAAIYAPLAAWRSRFYHFRALRAGTQREQQVTSPPKLQPDGGNLAGVLHYLATDERDLFEQVRELITDIVPDVGQLQVPTGGERLRVVFGNVADGLNLKDVGTGVEQLLMTIVVGLTEAPPFTMLIEEPETNLHPAAQRALLGLLQGWTDDRLIVAATHSPVMLNWSPGGDRLWHVSREQGVSQVEPVGEDPIAVLRSLGVQLSDVLSADKVLVLEGPSDADVLEAWFPEVLRNPRVAVLDGEGGDNAQHADRLAQWLAGADRVGLRRVLYLRDPDELSAEALEKLRRSPTVRILAKRELENYLLDPGGVATALRSLVPEGTEPPTEEAVAAAMSEAAEGLRQKIIVNRVCRRVRTAQPLIDHALRKELAGAGSDLEQVITALSARLMAADALRAQVTDAWTEAERDVARHQGAALLDIAPGEEILDAILQRFAGRRYRKRRDGPLIAKVTQPPSELKGMLAEFMTD